MLMTPVAAVKNIQGWASTSESLTYSRGDQDIVYCFALPGSQQPFPCGVAIKEKYEIHKTFFS